MYLTIVLWINREKKFAANEQDTDGRWKMIFSKERYALHNAHIGRSSPFFAYLMNIFIFNSKKEPPIKNFAFPADEDDHDDHPKESRYASTSQSNTSYPSSKYEHTKQLPLQPPPPTGPPVLDKFGSFRRADQGESMNIATEPHNRSRSKSRSRSRSYSSSRSSPSRRRRSRSRYASHYSSIEHWILIIIFYICWILQNSRSSYRSYSRSRSRSGSYDRHRNRVTDRNYHRPRYFNNNRKSP